MADKTMVKLNIGERFTLLALIANFNDYATYKIVQKLRMTLAPDEKENEEYEFESLFHCPYIRYDKDDDGKKIECQFEEYGRVAPKCPVHDVYCEPTGMMKWKPEVAAKEKEIWLGNKAKSLIVETLTKLNNEKKLATDMDISLYIKFVKSEEEDEEE